MKQIPIYNGKNTITITDDKLVEVYETIQGKIDTICCEYMLATDKIDANTTLSNEDLSKHVIDALKDELEAYYQIYCNGGYEKLLEMHKQSQEKNQ